MIDENDVLGGKIVAATDDGGLSSVVIQMVDGRLCELFSTDDGLGCVEVEKWQTDIILGV